ncbi:methylenetetrahydrofolate reductase [Roseinatronobacter alkalisoli]|uniref:Methylenetetrahydrofolate reductase n=1 Tax=Roseinatronobacter alkalisoli TaxID=3028235 RepID=A0ABT5TA96_9RHOB|nr:methylenetetrahydrofolate reductase [Roseinatronobacter sp. HJB301]MDD7972040.1 methylenetetrahydrofolate reductase [Roseinatronobacter sp. HJB301]
MANTDHMMDMAGDLLNGWSIEVMPRTAAKVPDFRALLPAGTRVYIAHIDGTPIEEMVDTARRLHGEGFAVMPHFPARSIPDLATLKDWIDRYRSEAGVDQALVLAGGIPKPAGAFESSIDLLQTGAFQDAGFTRLHVAGHPEGNRDIDADGGNTQTDAALRWKTQYARDTGVDMAIITQFAFEGQPVFDWIARLRAQDITLPVHVGLAGPAKLQTLIKFAIACGVGPSLNVLKKRARDLSKLLVPYTPDQMLQELRDAHASQPANTPDQVHFFPLGGIKACAEWAQQQNAGRLRRVVG